jgi:hypothetical protein
MSSSGSASFTEVNGIQYYTNKYGRCVRLTAVNYTKWKAQVSVLLHGGNQFGIVMGTEAEPEGPNSTNRSYDIYKSYQDRKRDAVTMLYNSLSDNVQPRFESHVFTQNPATFWTAIKTQMNIGQNSISSATLLGQFHKEEWKSDGAETLQSWITRINDYRNRLDGSRHPLSETDAVIKLLMGLPSQWSTTRENILDQAEYNQSWDQVVQTLQAKEVIVNAGQPVTSNDKHGAALAVRGRGGYRGRGNGQGYGGGRGGRGRYGGRGSHGSYSDNSGKKRKWDNYNEADTDADNDKSNKESIGKDQCLYCLEEGHWRKNCPLKKKAKRLANSRGSRGGHRSFLAHTEIEEMPPVVENHFTYLTSRFRCYHTHVWKSKGI